MSDDNDGQQPKEQPTKEINALGSVLSTRQGRFFVWQLLSRCRVFRSSYNDNTHRMAESEGRRAIGLGIMSDIETHFPEFYTIMVNEQQEDSLHE